jgi:7-carboxy-7-deazaguanine synthase
MTQIKIPAAKPSAAEGEATPPPHSRTIAFAKPSEFIRTRENEIRINEIFYSLQGESSRVGLPTVFVRLTGCPLRCDYCDTAYAFHEGKTRAIDEVLAEVATFEAQYVCVTGGEPLAQKTCHTLLTKLCDSGYSVSLETSGAIDVANVDKRVSRIVDIKTPGSGEVKKNRWENLAVLNSRDEIKFVITSLDDYEWSRALLHDKKLNAICPILFSPSFGVVGVDELALWILRDKLPVRMQVQLHKIIWGGKRGV